MVSFANDDNGNIPLYYLPIVLGSNAGTGFSQQIVVNSSTYSAYESSDLSNINFQDGAGNLIPSWLESGLTNGSTSTIYWIKMPATITTVYMVFVDTSKKSMSGTNTGAMPTYTGTYAQYDNGATVFPTLYQNFSGVSTPTGWTSSGVTISNGVKTSSSPAYMVTTATYGLSSSQILDIYGYTYATSSTGDGWLGYVTTGYDTDSNPVAAVGAGIDTSYTISVSTQSNVTGGDAYSQIDSLISVNVSHVFTTYFPSISSVTGSVDYANATTLILHVPTINVPVGLGQRNTTVTSFMQYIRIRTTVDSTIPSQTPGSITPIGGGYSSIIMVM